MQHPNFLSIWTGCHTARKKNPEMSNQIARYLLTAARAAGSTFVFNYFQPFLAILSHFQPFKEILWSNIISCGYGPSEVTDVQKRCQLKLHWLSEVKFFVVKLSYPFYLRKTSVTLFILRAEMPSCRLLHVWQMIPSTQHCFTALIHSTRLWLWLWSAWHLMSHRW